MEMRSSIWRKLERAFAAVAFADEHDSARRMMGYSTPIRKESILDKFNKLAMAVAFAEADCHDSALEMLSDGRAIKTEAVPSFASVVGLEGIRVWYGVAEVS
jgi:hypothetical protein